MVQEWLREKVAAAERRMQSQLDEARATFEQSGDKGASAEEAFRGLLRTYLPRSMGVGQGEVVDTHGNRSAQTDVVIATDDHPFTYTETQPGLFFIEGVVGAGEVKSILTSDGLEEAITKAKMFKQLRMAHMKGTMIHTNPSDLARFYECPPYFLFAYKSQLTLESVLARLAAAQQALGLTTGSFLDAAFLMSRGSAVDVGDGRGTLAARTPEGEEITGWMRQSDEHVLFDLLGWLSGTLPRFVRFQPILSLYLVEHLEVPAAEVTAADSDEQTLGQ